MNNNLTMKIIWLFGIIVAGALVLVGYNWAINLGKSTLRLTVVPADATVTIDNKTKTKPGDIKLDPGLHTLIVSRTGFDSKAINITIEKNQTISQSVVLGGNSQAAQNYFQDNADQKAQAEGIAGAKLDAEGTIITQNNPLIQLLPYRGTNFRIDFGGSQAHKDNPEAIAIYISVISRDPASKANALKWINAQGYDPAQYEIIYQDLR